MPEKEARDRSPKSPRCERREAGVPRYGTQGASPGAWPAALCAGPTGASQAPVVRLSALRYPFFRVREAKKQNPGAKNAPRERDGLCEIGIMKAARSIVVLILRSAKAQQAPQIRASLRASRRMRTAAATPSYFETHRSAPWLWNVPRSPRSATLSSMRASPSYEFAAPLPRNASSAATSFFSCAKSRAICS